MNKRKINHYWHKYKNLSLWWLIIAVVVSGLITAFALRQNNLIAIKLRDDVLQTDKQNGNTEASLQKLRSYVYSHMNTDLAGNSAVYPPVQLKYRYERLVAAEKARVAALNGNVYNDAQVYCEKNSPQSFYGAGRLPCIQAYIDSRPGSVKETPIPDSLYKFDFVSPVWTPDLAGVSLVLFVLFSFALVVRLILQFWLRSVLRSHA